MSPPVPSCLNLHLPLPQFLLLFNNFCMFVNGAMVLATGTVLAGCQATGDLVKQPYMLQLLHAKLPVDDAQVRMCILAIGP